MVYKNLWPIKIKHTLESQIWKASYDKIYTFIKKSFWNIDMYI